MICVESVAIALSSRQTGYLPVKIGAASSIACFHETRRAKRTWTCRTKTKLRNGNGKWRWKYRLLEIVTCTCPFCWFGINVAATCFWLFFLELFVTSCVCSGNFIENPPPSYSSSSPVQHAYGFVAIPPDCQRPDESI